MTAQKRRVQTKEHNLKHEDKLQHHSKSHQFELSDRSLNLIGKGFVWFNTISLVLEGFTLLLPHYFTPSKKVEVIGGESPVSAGSAGLLMSMAITIYLALGTFFQWKYLRDGVPDTVTARDGAYQSDRKLPQGWHRCSRCKLDCPPRSHHCSVCNICVLKRDHHCFFSGSCVGYHNQRHFIMFLIYAMAASIYGAIMQYLYITTEEGVAYLIPIRAMWSTVFNRSRALHLILLLHLYLCIIISISCITFIFWQIRIILRGQTSYEAVTGSTKYCYSACYSSGGFVGKKKIANQCRYENFVDVCGKPLEFLLCLLIPLYRTRLRRDGIKWNF